MAKSSTVSIAAALLSWTVAATAAAQTHPGQTSIPATGGPIVVTPIMHASVMIEYAGRIVLVDPAMGDMQKMKPADLILVTDIHEDHFNAARIERFRRAGAAVVVPAAVRAELPPTMAGPIEVLANGQRRTIGGVAVEAVASYNIEHKMGNEPFHTKGRANGYVIAIGGKRLFFAGDTECVPEIKALQNIDVAFLPMNLPFTMSPEDAAACAAAFGPRTAIPYHWMGGDPAPFAAALKSSTIDVRMLDWYPPIERPDVVAITRPGALVDVGGRTLHLYCTGRGAPTVILDAGDEGFAIDWMLVQPEIAKSRRVCAFDRPGRGWSAPDPKPDSDDTVVTALHAALLTAGERGPFVLVGAEIGANAMRVFQMRFPGEVRGIVLVDGFHEDSAIVMRPTGPVPAWSVSDQEFRAEIETMRPPPGAPLAAPPPMPPSEDAPFDRLGGDVLKTRVTFEMRARQAFRQRSFDDRLAYFEADRAVLKRLHEASVRQPPQFGDQPLISLRAKQADPPFAAPLAKLALLSSKGIDRVIEAPVPHLHLSQPGAVIAAVNEVAMAASVR